MPNDKNRHLHSRWGDPELDDRYYVRLPGWMLFNLRWFVNVGHIQPSEDNSNQVTRVQHPDYGKPVGITSGERTFMETVMAFKFDSPNTMGARPSMGLIAHIEGITIRSTRMRKKSLIEKGALAVEYDTPRMDTDTYIFAEVVRQCRIFQQFWMENNLIESQYKEREEFVAGEGAEAFQALIETKILLNEGRKKTSGGGGRKLPGGEEENFPQRIRIQEKNSDDTIKIVSSHEDFEDDESKQAKSEEGNDSNQALETDTSAVDSGKVAPARHTLPRPPQSKGKERKSSKKRSAGDSEYKRARNRDLGRWIKAILVTSNTHHHFRGFEESDQIAHTRKNFGHQMRAAGTMRGFFEDTVKMHSDVDLSGITPDELIRDYYGDHRLKNGWLFRHKFDGDITVGPSALANHFAEYLADRRSLIGKRIAKHKQNKQHRSETDMALKESDEYVRFKKQYMKMNTISNDDSAED